jgi:TolB-like protein
MRSFFILSLLLATAMTANAVNTLAVLEIIPKPEIEDISITETRHLTDELRKQAVLALPNKDYAVLTRDNMLALLPPDEAEAECLAESCAVEIGRAIGAEYISQGSLGRFGDELSVAIELYETMSGKLLGSIVMESKDVKGLLTAIREQAPALFARIKKDSPPPTETSIPTNIPAESKSKAPMWIAISLDVLGAAAIGFGVYNHIQKDKLYKDYQNMLDHRPQKEYDSALKKANDAKDMRDIGFIVGGVLVGAGIAVHVWF